jgi:hypothetical protein
MEYVDTSNGKGVGVQELNRTKSLAKTLLKVPVIIFISLALISCGASDSQKSSAISQNPTYPTAVQAADSSNGANVSKSAAGKKYLEIVNPVNCAIKAELKLEASISLGDGTLDPSYLKEIQAAYGKAADAKQTAFRQMLEFTWPTDVQGEMKIIAAEWAQDANTLQDIADAYDLAVFNEAVTNLKNRPTPKANPGLIRGLLGVGPSTETDRC